MINTLGELYNYTNEILLQGELDSINVVIEYFEEAQQMIALQDPIEAKITIPLTSNVIILPADYQDLCKIKVDYENMQIEVIPAEIWGSEMTLNPLYNTGNAYLYYYKRPTLLNPSNASQVPDIDSRYLPQIAKYAAKMYYLVDDDQEQAEEFRKSFFDTMTYYNKLNGNSKSFNFRNVW